MCYSWFQAANHACMYHGTGCMAVVGCIAVIEQYPSLFRIGYDLKYIDIITLHAAFPHAHICLW